MEEAPARSAATKLSPPCGRAPNFIASSAGSWRLGPTRTAPHEWARSCSAAKPPPCGHDVGGECAARRALNRPCSPPTKGLTRAVRQYSVAPLWARIIGGAAWPSPRLGRPREQCGKGAHTKPPQGWAHGVQQRRGSHDRPTEGARMYIARSIGSAGCEPPPPKGPEGSMSDTL